MQVEGAVVGKVGVIHSRVNSPRRAEGLRNSLPLQDVVQGSKRNAQSLALVSGTGETVQDGGPLARQHSSSSQSSSRQHRRYPRRQPVAMMVAHALTVDRCMQEDPMRTRFAALPVMEQGVRVCSSMQLDASSMLNRKHVGS